MRLAPPIVERPAPPVVERRDDPGGDPYAWLKAENWRQVMRDPQALAADIRCHLEAEETYLNAVMAPFAELRERLYWEMRGRLAEADESPPQADGPWLYYTRFVEGGEQPLHCRRRRDGDGREAVLIDGNAEAAAYGFYRIGMARHSPDHRLIAYTLDTTGSEAHELRIKDLETGAFIDAGIDNAWPNFVWSNDSSTLFYVVYDDHHRPYGVRRHRIGSAAVEDAVVHDEADPSFYVNVVKTDSRRFILIVLTGHSDTSELRFIDADRPESSPRLIAARRRGVRYDGGEWQGRFILRTNAGGAEDFKLVEAPVETPGPENWRELVPHRPGRLIIDLMLFQGWLVRRERREALQRLVVRRLADGAEHELEFDEATYDLMLQPGFEFRSDSLRFTYSSPATPLRTLDYDMAERRRVLRKEQAVPCGHDRSCYVLERIMAPSHDGAAVPVSILRRKDVDLDGTAPLWLYGYGAYGMSVPTLFNSERLSAVERGFVYAIAHVRGGMERGHRWYREGKMLAKCNSFLDLIAAAEALIGAGYASAGNIVLHGRSAGGLLVGAAANMRPELFRAVCAEVPFVDVLNTMSDASLPLTPPEWDEWGNPLDDPEARAYIASYCPYQNLGRQAYPHVLATGGLSDPRVTYWEPAKWIAKLRELKSNDSLALLHVNMEAGHAGSAGRFERLREVALVYAFALMATGKAAG
jgi:oligopeptidase B